MSIIKVLPENLVNQIAAGEVVERPASVVKELVENSLDAGASVVSVELESGGATLIRIKDNGGGMSEEDLGLAVVRHATSKISEEADLWKIGTMGFRGEALASIGSVSKMTVKSRREQDIAGHEIVVEGGSIVRKGECGMAVGTIIEVSELFFNTPARQKYLKKESTELGHISSVLNKIALANPAVALKLVHNGKEVFDLSAASDLISRIADVFGSATADAMIPIFYGGSDFEMDGFIGKPLLARSSSKHQYFFVNGRPIQHFLLANAIKRAFHSMLMEDKRPIFVINIKIDPALIDVNVHPRKIEIRFEDEKRMMSVVYGAVKTALEKASLIPKAYTESQRYMSDAFPVSSPSSPISHGNYGGSVATFSAPRPSQPTMDFRVQGGLSEEKPKIKAITQILNSYIVAQNEEGLVLIDQHAAHERVRYEELMDGYEAQQAPVQPLLMPLALELSADESGIVEAEKEIFEKLGFAIEHFGGKTFSVSEVPSCLAAEDLGTVIRGVIDDILSGKGGSKFQGRVEEVLTYMSCRSAIKFGQSLQLSEMDALMEQMEGLKRPFTCPHGRPTMLKLTLDELNKMFGRK